MARLRLSMRSLMLATAVLATCFATLGVVTGGVVSVGLLVLVANRHSVPWRTLEFAATLAWLLGAGVVFSDVVADPIAIQFVCLGGCVLAASWAVRMTVGRESRKRWAGCLLVPSSGLLGLVLWATDWDFRLRLALSEPALRAEARGLRPVSVGGQPHLCGLFWFSGVQRQGSIVRWSSGSARIGRPGDAGLAYAPKGTPPAWIGYRPEHIAGPWWRFRWGD